MNTKSKLILNLKKTCLGLLEKILRKKTLRPSDLISENIKRILLILPQKKLQELLLTTPVFRAVRQHFPKAQISALTGAGISVALLNNVYLDEVISGRSGWSPIKVVKLLKKLRSNFNLVIVLNTVEHSFLADFMAYLTGADYILGSEHLVFEGCRGSFFYNLRAPYSKISEHQTERNLDIVRYIGIDTKDFAEEVYLTQKEKNRAVAFLQEQQVSPEDLLLAVHLGCTNSQSNWPVERFVQVVKFFSMKHQAKIVVSWGAGNDKLANEFKSGLPFMPIDVSNLGFRQLSSVFFFCNLVICHDPEIVHSAAAVGIPVVSLFGQSDPHEWKPVGKQIIAIKSLDGRFTSISEEQVVQRAEQLLEDFPKSARLNFEEWDISDQVLKNYLNILDSG